MQCVKNCDDPDPKKHKTFERECEDGTATRATAQLTSQRRRTGAVICSKHGPRRC